MSEENKRPARDEKTSDTKVEKGLRDDPFSVAPTARRVMCHYTSIDTSGSMDGPKIAAVNQAMKDIVPMMMKFSESNTDAEIKMNVQYFSDKATWQNPAPVPINKYKWKDCTADGGTNYGEAAECVEARLHRSADMGEKSGVYVPTYLLLSDGHMNVDAMERFRKSLAQNKWFRVALKRAIAIGNDADTATLAEIVGGLDHVITVHNIDALEEILRLTTQGLSTIGSTSSLTGSGTKDDQLTGLLKDGVDSTEGAHFADDPVAHIEDEWD